MIDINDSNISSSLYSQENNQEHIIYTQTSVNEVDLRKCQSKIKPYKIKIKDHQYKSNSCLGNPSEKQAKFLEKQNISVSHGRRYSWKQADPFPNISQNITEFS